MIGFCASAVVRGIRAHRSARPGAYSKSWFSMPSCSKILLKNSAARISLPGGLVVSICRYFRSHSIARSEYWLSRSGRIAAYARAEGGVSLPPTRHQASEGNPRIIAARKTCSFGLRHFLRPAIKARFCTHFLYQLCQNYPAQRFLPTPGAVSELKYPCTTKTYN